MSERILIVDDDPVQRRLLDNMVRKSGYDAIVADGGAAAMTALTGADGGQIDAGVLDLGMPDLDGLCGLAKMREAGLTIPGIVQTAPRRHGNWITTLRAGGPHFVV